MIRPSPAKAKLAVRCKSVTNLRPAISLGSVGRLTGSRAVPDLAEECARGVIDGNAVAHADVDVLIPGRSLLSTFTHGSDHLSKRRGAYAFTVTVHTVGKTSVDEGKDLTAAPGSVVRDLKRVWKSCSNVSADVKQKREASVRTNGCGTSVVGGEESVSDPRVGDVRELAIGGEGDSVRLRDIENEGQVLNSSLSCRQRLTLVNPSATTVTAPVQGLRR